jgi:DNA polymerase (family 10)
MERVLDAARNRGVAMELSANPDRLDLSDVHARMAKERGVKLVINTDAHAPSHFDFLRFGVGTARRGWLTAEDVLNTREPDEFLELLHRGHR